MYTSVKTKKAFSLIEMLMVLFIISLATGSVFASLRNNRRKGDLELAARQLSAAIRQAQNDAISGRKTSSSNKTCGLGVAFGVTEGGNGTPRTKYIIKKSEKSSCDGNIDTSAVVNDGTALLLKSSFRSDSEKAIFDVGAEKWLFFSNPHANVFYGDSGGLSTLNTTLKISIKKNNADSDVIDVCVYPSGRVTEGSVHSSGSIWNCP